jgi:hypothetical protein
LFAKSFFYIYNVIVLGGTIALAVLFLTAEKPIFMDIKIKYKSYKDRIFAFRALGFANTIKRALKPLESEIREEGATITLVISNRDAHLEVDSTGKLHDEIFERMKTMS